MQWPFNLAVAGIFLAVLAQQPPQNPSTPAPEPQAKPAPPCRKDRTVDEYIAEIRKSKKQRNKNPLPSLSDVCIFGWCKGKVEPTQDRKSTRLNSSHIQKSRMPSSA